MDSKPESAGTQQAAQPGWYVAQGDPVGTLRYWNGSEWVGEPVSEPAVEGSTTTTSSTTTVPSESPVVEWSTTGLAQPSTDYAHWGRRVVAVLVDVAVLLPFAIAAFLTFVAAESADAGSIEPESSLWIVGVMLILAAVVAAFVNSIIVHGITGQTVGKRVMKTMLIQEANGQPAGIGRVIGRGLLAVIAGNLTFSIFTFLDLLWPLWDAKNQRIADKVTSTVVIRKPTS